MRDLSAELEQANREKEAMQRKIDELKGEVRALRSLVSMQDRS